MHDRPALRAAVETGEAIRAVSRRTGASRNAVRRAVRPGSRDSYEREAPSAQHADDVARLLARYPYMTVESIATLLEWPMSIRTLHTLVARLRPAAVEASASRATVPRLDVPRLDVPQLTVRRLSVGRLS